MIYIDDAAIPFHGKLRYHMTADTIAELHAFAESIGVRRCWFHKTHYDVTAIDKIYAIKFGAIDVSKRRLAVIAKGIT